MDNIDSRRADSVCYSLHPSIIITNSRFLAGFAWYVIAAAATLTMGQNIESLHLHGKTRNTYFNVNIISGYYNGK